MRCWKAFLHFLIMTWILRLTSAAKGMLPNEGHPLVEFASNVRAVEPPSASLVSTDIPAKKALLGSASAAMGRVRNEWPQTSALFASHFGKNVPPKNGGRHMMNSIIDGRGSITHTISTDIPAKNALLSSASAAMGRVRNEWLQTSVVFASHFVRAPVPPTTVSIPTYIGKNAPPKKGGRRLMNGITDGRGSVTHTISTEISAKKPLLSSASVAMGRVRNEGLQTSVVFASNFVRAPVPPSAVSIPSYIGKPPPKKKGGRRLMNSMTDGTGVSKSTKLAIKDFLLTARRKSACSVKIKMCKGGVFKF